MANRTVKDAHTVKGTNPQYLIEKIIRMRIYDSKFWKEECFALTAELLVDKAMELKFIGGTYAGNIKPAPFLCLTLKMLQIQPEKDIIIEFIKNEDFKYVRALGAYYLRLTGTAKDCYKYLEPLLNDYRKIRIQNRDGKFELSHMDEFIDLLLREERACDVILPRIQKRYILEENGDIEPKKSILEDDLDNDDDDEDEDDDQDEEEEEGEERSPVKHRSSKEIDRVSRSKRSRSRSRDRTRKRSRSRSRSRDRNSRAHRKRSRSRERDRRDKDRKSGSKSGGGGKDELSVEETNKIRASLGLAPLK